MIEAVRDYNVQYSPLNGAKLVWYKVMACIQVFGYTPYFIAAIYAFYSGESTWILMLILWENNSNFDMHWVN